MTWQLFTVVQIAAFALTAVGVLCLRNFRLRRRNEQLLALCSKAHDELVNVTGKLASMEALAPPEKMLAERVKGLTASDDPIATVRRLVLENEIKPRPDFGERLAEHLASQEEAPPDEEEFARRWRSIREECHQLAMFLVADEPSRLVPLKQIFEVIQPLDEAYGIDLPPLAVRESAEPSPDASEEADGSDDEALDQDALDAMLSQAQGGVAGA